MPEPRREVNRNREPVSSRSRKHAASVAFTSSKGFGSLVICWRGCPPPFRGPQPPEPPSTPNRATPRHLESPNPKRKRQRQNGGLATHTCRASWHTTSIS